MSAAAATRLQREYAAYMAEVRAEGKPVVEFLPPCGCETVETEAPPKGGEWDSMMTCPHCTAVFYKVVNDSGVRCSGVLR